MFAVLDPDHVAARNANDLGELFLRNTGPLTCSPVRGANFWVLHDCFHVTSYTSRGVTCQVESHLHFNRWHVTLRHVTGAGTPGSRLRALREAADLSQLQLSEATGVDRSAISNIELGKVGLGYKRAAMFAQALDVDVKELLPGGRGAPSLDQRLAKLELMLSQLLSPGQVAAVELQLARDDLDEAVGG